MKENTIWKGKRVLLTGHTGFKGSWMSLWLNRLGAKIHGVALDPQTQTNLFTTATISKLLSADLRVDIRDLSEIKRIVHELKPEVVFHLAAQPLVNYSYDFPIETYAVNVMGTAHLLEAIRSCDIDCTVVVVTTDKCYENSEAFMLYRETDKLGGADPYSSSKACAELVTQAYRASYFASEKRVSLATARAGNVIGGGDWAAHRLLPDCVRAYMASSPLSLRFPHAIRPWQHVFESIKGYVSLAEHMLSAGDDQFNEAWNFGPEIEDMWTAGEVAKEVCKQLGVAIVTPEQFPKRYEATLLRLDSTKAKEHLQWTPQWPLQKAIAQTVAWYRQYLEGADMLAFSQLQIERYLQGSGEND